MAGVAEPLIDASLAHEQHAEIDVRVDVVGSALQRDAIVVLAEGRISRLHAAPVVQVGERCAPEAHTLSPERLLGAPHPVGVAERRRACEHDQAGQDGRAQPAPGDQGEAERYQQAQKRERRILAVVRGR